MSFKIGDKAWYNTDSEREPVQVSAIYTGHGETLYDADSATTDKGWGEITETMLTPRNELVSGEDPRNDDEILEVDLGEKLALDLRALAKEHGRSPSQEMLHIMKDYLDNNVA